MNRKIIIHSKKADIEGFENEYEAAGFIDKAIQAQHLQAFISQLITMAKLDKTGIPGHVTIDEGEFFFKDFTDPYQLIGFITVHLGAREREALKQKIFTLPPGKLAGALELFWNDEDDKTGSD